MTTVMHDGKPWRIVSIGARRDGKAYCHLASTNLGKWQRNGFYPLQMADWIDEAVIEAAPADYSSGPVSDGGMDPRDRHDEAECWPDNHGPLSNLPHDA